jgi:spore coat protein A
MRWHFRRLWMRCPLPETIQPVRAKLSVTMREVRVPLHRDLAPAKLWGYAGGDGRHRGVSANPQAPVIELRRGEPVEIKWINQLPRRHTFTIDHSLGGCERGIPDVRTVTHMHGARVRPKDDGYPEEWYRPGQSRVCRYPHAAARDRVVVSRSRHGVNRLNIYAGMAGMVLLRDAAEDALGLPRRPYEVPLILYDRMLTRAAASTRSRLRATVHFTRSALTRGCWLRRFACKS